MKSLMKSLKGKVVLLFLGFVLASTALIGIVSTYMAAAALRTQYVDMLSALGQAKEETLIVYIKEKMGRASDYTAFQRVQRLMSEANNGKAEAAQELSRLLAGEISKLDPEAYETFVLDLKGRVAASSVRERVGLDRSGYDYFKYGKNKTYITDVYR